MSRTLLAALALAAAASAAVAVPIPPTEVVPLVPDSTFQVEVDGAEVPTAETYMVGTGSLLILGCNLKDPILVATGDRTVRMKTTATNGRATPVSWDLWPNTRVRPEGFPYVPLDPNQPLRVDGPRPDDPEARPYLARTLQGWLSLPPGQKPEGGRKRLWAKAYVRPARGLIAYFHGPHLLLIRAEVVPVEELLALGSLAECRTRGKLKLEGKEYVVRDGDVVHVRFNV